jgi:hypothetical protein
VYNVFPPMGGQALFGRDWKHPSYLRREVINPWRVELEGLQGLPPPQVQGWRKGLPLPPLAEGDGSCEEGKGGGAGGAPKYIDLTTRN